MASILMRDINDEANPEPAVWAATNQSGQHAETRSILEAGLSAEPVDWLSNLQAKAAEVGGVDLPIQPRHTPRVTGVKLS